jgi:short-subunit dehydrogenase
VKDLHGRVALVTGASGGLGVHIARALAREGMHVALCARREDALTAVAEELRALGVRTAVVPADLGDLDQVGRVVDDTETALGPIDVLVNNAGIELTASFTRLSRDELTGMVDLNLTSPLLLTHRVVPGMLSRGRGHVVFMSSAAGQLGPPYEAPYAATKAALIGLSKSLRAEYAGTPVSFTVVCPGFVAGDGMWQRMLERGARSNFVIRQTTTDRLTARVVKAIRRDTPEVIETGAPSRPFFAFGQIAPRTAERATRALGIRRIFRREAAERGRLDESAP